MALILTIDTALDTGYIVLMEDERPVSAAHNENKKDHAAWIQNAVFELLQNAGRSVRDLDAVGVCIGPGSYTGLRIGLSTAKGICYALNIPMIAQNNLKVLAYSAIREALAGSADLPSQKMAICPMIDARRMEVYTAVYDAMLTELVAPQAMIVDSTSFTKLLTRQKMLFVGNGSYKFQQICHNQNAIFEKIPLNPFAAAALTYENFIGNNFADIAYTEPLYVKEFFTKNPGQ